MKATEQYFPVVLFIMLYKVVLAFESVIKSYSVAIQMKATEQLIMLCKIVLSLFCELTVWALKESFSFVHASFVWPYKWKLLSTFVFPD